MKSAILAVTLLLLNLYSVSSSPCEKCLFVTQKISTPLRQNDSSKMFSEVCNLVTHVSNKECEDLINEYIDKSSKLLNGEVDSDAICQQLGLCNSTSLLRNKQRVKPVKRNQRSFDSEYDCSICKFVVGAIKTLVDKNMPESDILVAANKACDVLPYSVDCEVFIEEVGDGIFKNRTIILNADPNTFCDIMQRCTSRSATAQLKNTVTGECNVCKSLLDFLKIMMKNDEDFFQQVLTNYCDLLPEYLATECKNLLLTDLIDDITDDINLDKLCQDVTLCTTTKLLAKGDIFFPTYVMKKRSQRVQNSDIACEVCTQVLEELEVILPKENSIFTSAFSMACKKYLPEQANKVCQWVIVEIGDELIKLIADEINPREDCQAIKLCKSSPSLSEPWRSLSAAVPKQL